MRAPIAILVSLVVLLCAATALGQFGLYGAPERLPLQPAGNPQATLGSPVYAPAPGVAYQQMVPAPVQQRYAGSYQQAAPAPVQRQYVAQPQMVPAPVYQQYGAPVPSPAPGGQVAPARPVPMGEPTTQIIDNGITTDAYANGGYLGADCGQSCETASCASTCYAPFCPWYGGIYGLVLGRNQANKVWTSYQSNLNANQTQNSNFGLQWKGGGGIRFGYMFCCGGNACADPCGSTCYSGCGSMPVMFGLEVNYWTIDNFEGYSSDATSPSVSTPLDFSYLEFPVSDTVSDYFDTAAEHRLWRHNDIQNVEINLVSGRLGRDPCSRYNVGWLAGVRWFRFDETFVFGSVDEGHYFGESGGVYEAYLEDRIINDLVGLQIGADATYRVWGGLGVFIAPKIGLYNNHMRNRFSLYRGDGAIAYETDPGVTGTYPVSSSRDILSFMTEVDLGLEWQFCNCWSARIGYRVMMITGVGLADTQIPHYIVDIPEIEQLDSNANLILHGAYAGLTFNY